MFRLLSILLTATANWDVLETPVLKFDGHSKVSKAT